MSTKYHSSVGIQVLLISACITIFLLQSQSVAHPIQEDDTSPTSAVATDGNNTQDAYIIESVQFEIGTLESAELDDENSTALPGKTEKLSETQVAFLLPPAALFNSSSSSSS